jgi:peptide/nickel transport system substrate-binding protein
VYNVGELARRVLSDAEAIEWRTMMTCESQSGALSAAGSGRPNRRDVLAGLATAPLILRAGAAWSQEALRNGGSLVVAIQDNPPHLLTGISVDILTICVAGQIYNTLIKMDSKFQLGPSLAKSWQASADGLEYTFNLEPGVKWHDGRPFTSADVKHSFQEISGKYSSLARAAYKEVAAIEMPDDLTVVVRMNAPDPAFFPWAFSQPNFAQIFPKHIYEGTDPRTNPANFKPVGTGPFRFKEWVRGSHIVLERNPDYFRKSKIFLDRVVFQIIPDSGARQLALEKGEVDHLPYFALAPAAIEPLAHTRGTKVIDSVRPALGEIIMFLNLRHPQLAVNEVRQAIVRAIDRDLLVKLALNGHGRVATGPIRSDNPPFYNPDVPKYPRDVALANRLLDQAGVPRRAGGVRLALRLSYEGAGEGGALQSAAEIMREQLREVGIDLQLRPSDPAAWVDGAFVKWDFDMTMGSFGTGPDPKIAVSRLYKTENIQRIPSSNLMGYSNPKVDDLLTRADRDFDQNTRARLYKEAQAIMVDDLPAVWLWEKSYPIAVRDGLSGLPSGAMHSEVFENVGWTK